MYAEYKDVHRIQGCVRMYLEYKLIMIYVTESPQPYRHAILLPFIWFIQNLIIPGGLENLSLHNTSPSALKSFDKAITCTELVVS